MDEEETKNCPNCKREIPAVNFTIHTVHCARNIRVCPVCKEPVPSAELDVHHQKFHKLLPCKQCGESVCGTDLEDHIRDSCANTIKTCRFCELELPRRELPAHEGYCGVRTEQCPDCREWVMIKYRQLHLDSNHGFLRLDDDPAPTKKELPKSVNRPMSALAARPNLPSTSFGAIPFAFAPASSAPRQNSVANAKPTQGSGMSSKLDGSDSKPLASGGPQRPTSIFDGAGPSTFRNDFPRTQIRYLGSSNSGSSASSTSASPQELATSDTRPVSNGVKKRTNDQPQINTNKEVANKVDKNLAISRGAVKKRPAPKPPRASAPLDPRRDMPYYSAMERQQREERERREQNEFNLAHGLPPVMNPAAKLEKLRKMDALHNRETAEEFREQNRKRSPSRRDRTDDQRRREFQNLTPMSPEQFVARFNSLRVAGGAGDAAAGGDRFRDIKTSLRELRRGLNEVTAPYNVNNNTSNNNNDRASPAELRLPCEFCAVLVPADDLVQHQTGCRPDLARYGGAGAGAGPGAGAGAGAGAAGAEGGPVIPCEFCAESLPVYLIADHQERCAREVDILSAD